LTQCTVAHAELKSILLLVLFAVACEVCHVLTTVKSVYSGHPLDTTNCLLYRGGLLIQSIEYQHYMNINIDIVNNSIACAHVETLPHTQQKLWNMVGSSLLALC